jgi:ATP-binding cassette, subfamily B, bacterial IrtB/YbtQ
MIPVGLLYMVVRLVPAAAAGTHGIVQTAAQGPVFYATAVAGIFILLYIVNYFKYNAQYLSTYKESGIRHMSLAEKLRHLPLSFFGRKDLSDLTTTIMENCAVLETDFSHMSPCFIPLSVRR